MPSDRIFPRRISCECEAVFVRVLYAVVDRGVFSGGAEEGEGVDSGVDGRLRTRCVVDA